MREREREAGGVVRWDRQKIIANGISFIQTTKLKRIPFKRRYPVSYGKAHSNIGHECASDARAVPNVSAPSNPVSCISLDSAVDWHSPKAKQNSIVVFVGTKCSVWFTRSRNVTRFEWWTWQRNQIRCTHIREMEMDPHGFFDVRNGSGSTRPRNQLHCILRIFIADAMARVCMRDVAMKFTYDSIFMAHAAIAAGAGDYNECATTMVHQCHTNHIYTRIYIYELRIKIIMQLKIK